jgi:hypothetical protein
MAVVHLITVQKKVGNGVCVLTPLYLLGYRIHIRCLNLLLQRHLFSGFWFTSFSAHGFACASCTESGNITNPAASIVAAARRLPWRLSLILSIKRSTKVMVFLS